MPNSLQTYHVDKYFIIKAVAPTGYHKYIKNTDKPQYTDKIKLAKQFPSMSAAQDYIDITSQHYTIQEPEIIKIYVTYKVQ